MKLTNRITAIALATTFLASPAFVLAAEKKEKPAKPYPMEVCAVSGEKLGSMGEAYVFEYEGQQIKLCCKDCESGFKKDPKKVMAKVEEAAKKVKKYPAKTCIVSSEPLGEDAPASIFKGQEFKFCCKNCQKKFDKEPAKFADKLPKG